MTEKESCDRIVDVVAPTLHDRYPHSAIWLEEFVSRSFREPAMEECSDELVNKQICGELSLDEHTDSPDQCNDSILDWSDATLLSKIGSTTVSMPCPPEKVGPIIGKKGIVVQEIMRRSSCRIFVDQNFPEGQSRQIQITGHPSEIAIAIALILLVLEHGPSIVSPAMQKSWEDPELAENADSNIMCPVDKVGRLIGPKGNNIHEIYRRTGCRVQVCQDSAEDDTVRKVMFFGTPQQMDEAKALVSLIITGGSLRENAQNTNGTANNSTHSRIVGTKTTEADIDPGKVKLVIGAKGVIIAEIMKRSGCKIFINQNFPEGQPHRAVYCGLPQQIEVAMFLVDTVVRDGLPVLYTILNDPDSIIVNEFTLHPFQLNQLRSIDLINDIQLRYLVRIHSEDVPLPDSTVRIYVTGKPSDVHAALRAISQACGFPDSALSMNLQAGSAVSEGIFPAPFLGLGKDGTSGHLESVVSIGNDRFQQVAEIKNDVMGKVIGSKSFHLQLMKAKSGANFQVLRSDPLKRATRVIITGMAHSVSLAAQMIQEILVNGPAKLLLLPDMEIDESTNSSPQR